MNGIANIQRRSWNRIQGVTSEQVVKATPGVLVSLTLSEGAGNAATVTLSNGDTGSGGEVVHVFDLPANRSVTHRLEIPMDRDIRVTPSSADVDILAVYF